MKRGNTDVASTYDMYMSQREVRCLVYSSLLLACLCTARVLLKFGGIVGGGNDIFSDVEIAKYLYRPVLG